MSSRPIIEVVVRESDDDSVFACAAPVATDHIELNAVEREFLVSLLPVGANEVAANVWQCEANSNILNRLLVNGVRLGLGKGRAERIMQWHIDEGNVVVEDDDDDDDDEDLWEEDEE
jgi:hypothetical protein